MSRAAAALLALTLALTACSDDGPLSNAEREWCSFTGSTEADALKFDIIFEAGLSLDLNMDVLNAQAGALQDEYLDQGLAADEAVKKVSEDLFEYEDFVAACGAAYADQIGGS
jgi:hypothetical protein